MKFSSALTVTTVLSIMSATHGAPILSVKDAPSEAPTHYRRASSVSELQGRQYHGNDVLEGLNVAFEPGNSIKNLLSFVKRQLGSTDSTTNVASSDTLSSSSDDSEIHRDGPQDGSGHTMASAPSGLMGGGISSVQDAGFAHEPGQGIRTA